MSEFEPKDFLGETVRELRDEMQRFLEMSDISIPQVSVTPVIDDEYAQHFPAQNEILSDGSLLIYFHEDTVREKARSYTSSSKTYGELVKLYVGGSIITGTLLNKLQDAHTDSLNAIYQRLYDIDPLIEQMQKDQSYDPDQIISLKGALMRSNPVRRVSIGMQRFTAGILSTVYDETETMAGLHAEAESDIFYALRDNRQIQVTHLAAGYKEDYVDSVTDIRFTDAISETTLAMCFPMEPEEIANILRETCDAQEMIVEERHVFDSDEGDGFTIE